MGLQKIFFDKDLYCMVPETKEDNISPTFSLPNDQNKAYEYYKQNGYAVINGCISEEDCDLIIHSWNNQIKKYDGYLVRQSNGIPQKNIFNNRGWIMNSLQNIHTLSKKRLPILRNLYDQKIVDNFILNQMINLFLNTSRSRVVQSMYFEGNTNTEPHQDSYYLDDEEIGKMAACWIALEDIDWNAGRFYVCPGSHRYDGFNINKKEYLSNESNFIEKIRNTLKNYEIRAPFLKKGDILVWNSLTIHGSLPDVNAKNSRSSITTHFTTAGTKFRTYRNKLNDLSVEKRKYCDIYRPYDYDNFITRFKILFSVKFPSLKNALKELYVRSFYQK